MLKTNYKEEISRLLEKEVLKVIKLALNINTEQGGELYLAGGVVRDIILGRKTKDFDLLTTASGTALAEVLAKKLQVKPILHKRFETAKIEYGSYSFDITSSRSETYKKAGVLPDIKRAGMLEDLKRRDFTINSMALSLNKGVYGTLIDYHGGLKSLEKKEIRVLHNESFNDDATRIWRAIRYEQRLGFSIEVNSLKLLKSSIKMLETISGPRIRYELACAFAEKSPFPILRRAESLGVLGMVHNGLKADKALEIMLKKISERGAKKEDTINACFAALMRNLTEEDIAKLSARLSLKKKASRLIKDAAYLNLKKPELSNTSIAASKVYKLLKDISPQSLPFADIFCEAEEAKRNIKWYLEEMKNIKPKLSGDEIKALLNVEGAEISRLLDKLLYARLDGKIFTKKDEKAFLLAQKR